MFFLPSRQPPCLHEFGWAKLWLAQRTARSLSYCPIHVCQGIGNIKSTASPYGSLVERGIAWPYSARIPANSISCGSGVICLYKVLARSPVSTLPAPAAPLLFHAPDSTIAGPPWNASCAASRHSSAGASTEILIKSSGEILMKSYRVTRLEREMGISMTGPILCVFEHVQVICTYSHTNHACRTLMSMRKRRPRLALEWILLRRFWRVDSITKRAAF